MRGEVGKFMKDTHDNQNKKYLIFFIIFLVD